MRISYIIILLFYSSYSFSQNIIQGEVKDSKTKIPLSFCNIIIKGTQDGTITNEDGVFTMSVDFNKDSLLFSYLGYGIQTIPAISFQEERVVFLQRTNVSLQEFTVHTNNDYLYEILAKCRKKLLSNKIPYEVKTYYGIETQSKGQPIEFLECYYNGSLIGAQIDKLSFKNGRVGLNTMDGNYFESFNSAKAISKISMIYKSDYYPSIPLQFNKRKMKKIFELEPVCSDSTTYNIKFQPINKSKEGFSGEIWVDKESYEILKINLNIENANKHPFLPIHSCDSIYNVTFDINNTYKIGDNNVLLDHISFNYSFKYHSVRDSALNIPTEKHRVITREISSKGIIRLYDYDNPFIIPYFDYPSELYYGDYYKISFIPYNNAFWSSSNMMILTDAQKQNLGFFAKKGQLVNYVNDNLSSSFLARKTMNDEFKGHFSFKYIYWSHDTRIALKQNLPQNKEYTQAEINSRIQSELYNIKVQILLDVTQLGDSLQCVSYTVFDTYQTFYHLPELDFTNAFLNIFLDICEIERLKMEENLRINQYSLAQIDSVYNETIIEMDKLTNKYLKEVKQSKNWDSFIKWNKYVIIHLDIDNISMVKEAIKNRN